MLEKAHIYRSGCLAAGISALNAYLTPGETAESFLRYAIRETVGVVRDDLTMSMAHELNAQVKRVEGWGLPIPRDELGNPLKRGARVDQDLRRTHQADHRQACGGFGRGHLESR